MVTLARGDRGAAAEDVAAAVQEPVSARDEQGANHSSASAVMPTTSANPSWRSELKGLNRNEAKLHAVIAAADEIRPPVCATARMIPKRSRAP